MSLSDQVVMATSIETLIELLKNLPDYGRVSYVVTAKGDEVKTAFDIVDASALLVSNTLDGKINPDYPQELQPRDRTRASSLLQVNQISKDLRPAQLTDSGLSSHGAPIIGEDNAVESGNGRTMGIIKAYQDGNADRYREYLIDHATEFGIRPEKVESMTAPVLVRRRLTKVGRDGFDEIAQAIKNGDMPPAIDWFSIRPTRVKAFLSAAHSASPLAEMVQRLSLIFTDHSALGDMTLDEMKEASIQWADQQNEVNSDFLPAFRKAVSKVDDARGILKAFKALQSRVNKHVGDIDGVTAEGRDILKEHGITPEFIDEIRTDMQREVVSSLQIVARALADANPKSAAIVNRVIGDIEASEGMGALKLFLSRAFNPNGNILPGIIGEAKKYVSEEELEHLDQLLKRFSYNPQTRWQMNQQSMGSVHEKVLSAMNSAIANSSVSEEKALEWADSFITEEVEEARAGQNGGIDLRKELADIYRLTGGKISTLSKVVHHQGRAYANLNGVVAVNLNDENASALWHELGHHLEYSNPGLLEKARSFLKANVEGDKPSFVNIGGRGKPEWCFRSRLSNIYMAKVYPPASVSNTGKIRQKSPTISKTSATEVFSMALQLYHDKEAAAASLMNGDGLLELLLGVAKELNNAD
ncbi:hypothetical protein [Escherichia coli]|uniref:hypothetical protein n=1 Tax=Escherichia coli TaxID=562 RepID=UPI0039762196|nr:hypothetical protein [Escherichia coli]